MMMSDTPGLIVRCCFPCLDPVFQFTGHHRFPHPSRLFSRYREKRAFISFEIQMHVHRTRSKARGSPTETFCQDLLSFLFGPTCSTRFDGHQSGNRVTGFIPLACFLLPWMILFELYTNTKTIHLLPWQEGTPH